MSVHSHFHSYPRLQTLLVPVLDPSSGERHVLRALLDSASSRSFINHRWLSELHLKEVGKCDVRVLTMNPLSQVQQSVVAEVKVLSDMDTPYYTPMKLLTVNHICQPIPSYRLTRSQRRTLKANKLILADPEADSDGSLEIDMLIGQDYFKHFHREGELVLPQGLVLTNTFNGQYTTGGVSIVECSDSTCSGSSITSLLVPSFNSVISEFCALYPNEEVASINRFSDLDALGIGKVDTEISPILEAFFENTVHNGERYVVNLPWKEVQYLQLPTNFSMAFKRFSSWYNKQIKKKKKL